MEYVFVGTGMVQKFDNVLDIPFIISGFHKNYTEERSHGLCVPREELDDQPEFEGWLGPMWDGGRYRYETWEVYDMLSR